MAKAEEETLIEPPAKAGGGFPMVAVLLTAVLSGAAAAGGAWFAARTVAASVAAPAAEAAAAVPAPPREPVFIALEPPFTVNLADRDLMRYMQAEVQVMARSDEIVKRIEAHMPLVRNRLLMLFSAQTYEALSTPEGKQRLQELAAQEIATALGAADPEAAGIESVLFTSLVVQ